MEQEPKNKKKVIKKLRNKYRLVLLNDDTFEERISFRLTPLNVVSYVGLLFIVLIVSLISLIAFTPLREYIPGYSDVTTRKNATAALIRSDSLIHELNMRDQYVDNIRRVLQGDVFDDTTSNISSDPNLNYKNIKDAKSKEDSLFRAKIENEEQYTINTNLNTGTQRSATLFFFTPLKGVVTASFNADIEHYGVDVAAQENEAIKSVLDGMVIFNGFTIDNGYVIHVQHRSNLISAYKHCSVILKKMGETVKAGEPIAIVGNTGENSTGPHLHFELWENGKPINPEDYIVF